MIDLATRHVDHMLPWITRWLSSRRPGDPLLVSPDGRMVYCVYAITDPATGVERTTFADVWHLDSGVTEPVQKRLLRGSSAWWRRRSSTAAGEC